MSDDSIARIFGRLDETDVKVASGIARLEERIAAQPCREHQRLLTGNGQKGLVERVTIIESVIRSVAAGVERIEAASERQADQVAALTTRLAELESSERRRSKYGWILQTAITSAVASAVVSGLWAIAARLPK